MISVPIIVFNAGQANVFMSHQRTIDTLLCLPHEDSARTEMIDEVRRIYAEDPSILAQIEDMNQTYNSNSALQWYTRSSFLFRLINQALRFSNVELMFKLRYFLIDLYAQLDEIHRQTIHLSRDPPFAKLYRGQSMSRKEFSSFEQLIGRTISISTFFSTTASLQIALLFANATPTDDEFLSVLFCIETNRGLVNQRPYGNISQFSHYKDEEEVLFAMGSLFTIQKIEELDRTNPLPVIYLKMIDPSELNGSFVL